MQITLSQHFTIKNLIKLVYPSVIMMVFTSIYGVVDGIFVSNFVGDTAFAAVNLIMPVIMAYASFGFMIGAGGSALVSKLLGEGKEQEANSVFSLLVYTTVVLGAIITAVGIFSVRPLAILFGAEGATLEYCTKYGVVCLSGITLYMLQNVFQNFFPTAGKHKLGLLVIVVAGVTNAILDAVFLAGLHMGVEGAALASVLGQVIGGLSPILYFSIKRDGVLRLGRAKIEIMPVLKTFFNGSSEMLTNLSLSLVNILYNYQLMQLVGEQGVAAYGVIMYIGFIFISVFLGYSVGAAPVVGYNYGAGNREELKSVFKKSLIIISVTAVSMYALAMALNYPLCMVFVGYNKELFELTTRGFMLYAFSYLLAGFNIYASSFFTALNNGLISAAISFLRTLLFQVVSVMTMPLLFDITGVWLANPAAELMSLVLVVIFILTNRRKYGYM